MRHIIPILPFFHKSRELESSGIGGGGGSTVLILLAVLSSADCSSSSVQAKYIHSGSAEG